MTCFPRALAKGKQVLILLDAVLLQSACAVLWIVGGLLGAFTLLTAVTVFVALFSRDEKRPTLAWKILLALLAFLCALLTFRRRP
jgi:hypothetical protein